MVRPGQFQALIRDIAGQVFRGQFERRKHLVTSGWIKRVVTPIVAQVQDDRSHARIRWANGFKVGVEFHRVENLVIVSPDHIGRNAQESSGASPRPRHTPRA